MKKILTTLFILSMAFSAMAQTFEKDVIKFLGVPLEGSKTEFMRKIQAKGYTYDKDNDVLLGKFNGTESIIFVSENRGNVDRVYVAYLNKVSETQIRIHFNNLLQQFKNNKKYYEKGYNEPIPEGEDIAYELKINHKTYEAAFYPLPQFTDEEKAIIDAKVKTLETEEEQRDYVLEASMSKKANGVVWFCILESYGEYYIGIYYDNLDNAANGEDL